MTDTEDNQPQTTVSSATGFLPVRLKATDSDDVQVLSALLQDGLIASGDMHYDHHSECFILLVNRFCWELSEQADDANHTAYRCMCGLHISGVRRLSHRNFSHDRDTAQFYNLLTISYDQAEKQLNLVFSDGVEIRCEIDSLDIRLKDVAPPHPAQKIPDHQNTA